jgi:hypothetical protein
VKPRALPIPIPIVCAVDAYDKLGCDSKVNAHPAQSANIPSGLRVDELTVNCDV